MPTVATVTARQQLPHPNAHLHDPVDPVDSRSPLASLIHTAASTPQQSPRRFQFKQSSIPPPGARPPTMIRRASRFDPMDTSASPTNEDDQAHGDLGSRHPLRRIREDVAPHEKHQQQPPSRQDSGESVSLPGIKALLNVADQPPLLSSPFGNSLFSSPTAASASSAVSPLDSPRSRTSRFSSFASSEPGWWAPEDRDRSGSFSSASQPRGSFSRGPLNEEPDFKRRRSDLPPALEDADEVARLKWQAQSRNASFPVSSSGSVSGGSAGFGHGLRTMLYPPIASGSRGSISGNLPSPLSPSIESRFDSDYHSSSLRNSPMTGPLARSFAELSANDNGPSDRRPSTLSRRSNDSIPPLPSSRRESVASLVAPDDHPGRSLTRPPSPELSKQGAPRRSSLAELIMAQSGDDVAMRRSKENQYLSTPPVKNGDAGSPKLFHLAPRRSSTESALSVQSVPAFSDPLSPKRLAAHNSRRGSATSTPKPMVDIRRSSFASTVGGVDDDELDVKGDPGMHGMEVLAESARRVADAERNKAVSSNNASSNGDMESSPPKASGSSTGPKYTCQFCHKTFSRPSSLRIHTYSHTGERPYVCKEPTCRRRFSVQSNLKRHAKVHQIQAQQAQASQMAHQAHQRSVPPPHPGHMGGPMGHPPPPPVYNYAGRPPHPGPHMGHPSMGGPPNGPGPGPGYHGPPPFMNHPYDMPPHRGGPGGPPGHGPPPHDVGPMHYRPGPPGPPGPGGPAPGGNASAGPNGRRTGRNGFGPGGGGSGHGGDWVTDEEDELDDDVHCKREPA